MNTTLVNKKCGFQGEEITTTLPENNRPRVVIIGGGFAGLYLARSLQGIDLQIVLLDRNNFHTFQPLLYQVATAMLEPSAVASSFRKIFKGQQNFYFRMAEVERVDPANRLVQTTAGCIGYDYLVIATGARTNFYNTPEIEGYAYSMKDIPQAIAIRQRILRNLEKALITTDPDERERLMNIIIVGGGPTGVEIAGAIGELKKFILPADYSELDVGKMRIYLVEAADRLLSGMSGKASQQAKEDLEKKFSVTLWFNSTIKTYDGMTAFTSDNRQIRSRMLIWVAGVTGNIPAGLEKCATVSGGRLKTDRYNRVEGCENLYAIGDVAAVISDETPAGHPMLAPVAIQQARNLAKNIAAEIRKPQSAFTPFTYKSYGMMTTIGRNRAIVEGSRYSFGGFPAWLTWLFVHLITLVGFRNKLIALINWAWNYFSYDRGIRLIIPLSGNRNKNRNGR